MAWVSEPLPVLALLLAVVLLSAWLGSLPYLRSLGGALIAILLGALLANAGAIPTPQRLPALYDPIFGPVTMGAIFLVLLEANIRAIRRAGAHMLFLFAAGALGVMLGVLAAAWLLPDMRAMLGGGFDGVAAMLTGTYIGGSANFNALAIEYGIAARSTIFTATAVVDNVMTTAWILLTLALAPLLALSARFPRRLLAPPEAQSEPAPPFEGVISVALPLALAAGAIVVSTALTALTGGAVPMVLVLTTLALAVAQLRFAERIRLARPLGMFGLYLFLTAVGCSADLRALVDARALGAMLFVFVAIIFLVHLAVLLLAGVLLRLDPDMIAIASTANIGGATTAIALAEVRRRDDLVLPGLLVGALGTALGTYAGFIVAGLL